MSSHVSKVPRFGGTYGDRIGVNANSPGYGTSLPVSRMGLQISRIKLNFELLFAVVWNLARFLAKKHFFDAGERESPDHLDLQRLASLHCSTYDGLSSSVRYVLNPAVCVFYQVLAL